MLGIISAGVPDGAGSLSERWPRRTGGHCPSMTSPEWSATVMVQGASATPHRTSGIRYACLQATADHAFASLGGDKDIKFKTAREDLIEAVFREVEKLGMMLHCCGNTAGVY
jgi:hypothetical protein